MYIYISEKIYINCNWSINKTIRTCSIKDNSDKIYIRTPIHKHI